MSETTETTAKSVVDEEQRRVWLHVYATEFSNAWARDLVMLERMPSDWRRAAHLRQEYARRCGDAARMAANAAVCMMNGTGGGLG